MPTTDIANWDFDHNPASEAQILALQKKIRDRGILPALVPGKPWAGGYAIEQSDRELAEFCLWLGSFSIRSYVELGVSSGGLFRFMQETFNFEKALGIDLRVPPSLKLPPSARIVVGDLRNPESIQELRGLKADLVFVDADHSYDSIVRDTKTALGLTQKVIAFHDVAGLRECEGAKKHWSEVKEGKHIPMDLREACVEFIHPENPVGIGAVTLKGQT